MTTNFIVRLMKQILRRLILAGCGVLLAILIALYLLLPKQPDSWETIKLGMHSDQVYHIDPEFKKQGWKDTKGFDIMTAVRGKSYWQMLLTYDDDEVVSIQKRLYLGGLECFIYDHTTK